MASKQSPQTVQRLEFSMVVGQLFLYIGLLGMATLLEGVGAWIVTLIVVFVSMGMSIFYSVSANKARPKRHSPRDDAKQVG